MSKSARTVLVQFRFPEDLLKKIDARSNMRGDRTEFVRSACREKLERLEATEAPKRVMEVPAR